MGTRSGDVDPGLFSFLCDHLGMTTKQADTMLNRQSGLLGLTGKSDMRQVIVGAGARGARRCLRSKEMRIIFVHVAWFVSTVFFSMTLSCFGFPLIWCVFFRFV